MIDDYYGFGIPNGVIETQRAMMGITLASLEMMRFNLMPKVEKLQFWCHPSRYEMLRAYLIEMGAVMDARTAHDFAGIEIVQNSFVAASEHVRVRRWIPKRGRWYSPKKYRVEERAVLGWWVRVDGISKLFASQAQSYPLRPSWPEPAAQPAS